MPKDRRKRKIVQCLSTYIKGVRTHNENSETSLLKEREASFRPVPFGVPLLARDIRAEVLRWMSDVLTALNASDETYFLAVNYFDRVTNLRVVKNTNLQTLATTCMLLATKHEYKVAPPIEQFRRFCTGDSCSRENIVAMERVILPVLCYRLHFPTALQFLAHFRLQREVRCLAVFLLRLSSGNWSWLAFPSWMLALASVLLALLALRLLPSARAFLSVVPKSSGVFLTCLAHMHATLKDVMHNKTTVTSGSSLNA